MIKINIPNIDSICSAYTNYICKQKRKKSNIYIDYFKSNIYRIVSCKPCNLRNEISQFNESFPDYIALPRNDKEKYIFTKYMIGQYERMLKDYGTRLHNSLGITVCPYCNRQFTYSVSSKKCIHPEFDHFYSKTEFPYLTLSFYNLVPCCHTCNNAKGTGNIEINPYLEGFDNNAKFYIDRIDKTLLDSTDWKVTIKTDTRCKTNIDEFCLSELYEKHKDYVVEVVFRKVIYGSEYRNELMDFLHQYNLNTDEVNRILLGNYVMPEDFCKRPLSKLTYDIMEQIGALK